MSAKETNLVQTLKKIDTKQDWQDDEIDFLQNSLVLSFCDHDAFIRSKQLCGLVLAMNPRRGFVNGLDRFDLGLTNVRR